MISLSIRLLVAGLACAFAVVAQSQQAGSTEQRYPLSQYGTLILSVPKGWKEEVRQSTAMTPPTIVYKPESGAPYEVLLTAIWPVKEGMAKPTPEEMKHAVTSAAENAKAQAVEKSIAVLELKGSPLQGYYFRATDKAPKRGEYKYLTQGMAGLDAIRITFTVLTNDGQGSVVDTALAMFRGARLAPPQQDAQAAQEQAALSRPDRAKLNDLLESGQVAELEAMLAPYQDAYRAGTISEPEAAYGIRMLRKNDPDLRTIYDKWVAERPQSYAARVARARYRVHVGYLARGSEYASKTSQARFDDMRAQFASATEDLEAARKLEAKPALIYSSLISIAKGSGQQEAADRALAEAVALDPYVSTARASYFEYLRPEWGGSIEEMEAAMEQWKGAVSESQTKSFLAIINAVKSRIELAPGAEMFERKQYQQAVAFYDQAIARAETARAHTMRGSSYAQLGKHEKAIADFDRSLELDPDESCCSGTRSNRAQSYMAIGQKDKALAELIIVAENDNAWAARELAIIYTFGKYGFKPDPAKAVRWCQRSAKQGDPLSMYCMGGLYSEGVGVARDPKQAAFWYKLAAERGVADAQADFAYMLWHGEGIAQDKPAAVRWWRAAAKQDNDRARGQLYANLPWWRYFIQVAVAGWVDAIVEYGSGIFFLLLSLIGLGPHA